MMQNQEYEIISNREELIEYVARGLKPFCHSGKIFFLLEEIKSHPECFGYGSLDDVSFPKERLSSKEWKKEMRIEYTIVYPDKKLKVMLEGITKENLESKSCAEILTNNNIPLSLVIEYKTFLLRHTDWTNEKISKLDFSKIENTCRQVCIERKERLVRSCIPISGYC